MGAYPTPRKKVIENPKILILFLPSKVIGKKIILCYTVVNPNTVWQIFSCHTERRTQMFKQPTLPKEGDLYKIIHLYGKTFEIRYGFYEERDRLGRYAEPIEIYPDFIQSPEYTDEGIPFITAIQTPCQHFSGNRDPNSTCEECAYYQHREELLGICTCPHNIKGG